MTRFLCNASGAGKSTLLYIGLEQHFGLYFVPKLLHPFGSGHEERLFGSTDLQRMVHRAWGGITCTSREDLALQKSSNIIRNFTSTLLCSRLAVLDTFLRTTFARGMGEPDLPQLRRQWLLLQLYPNTKGRGTDVLETAFRNFSDSCSTEHVIEHLGFVQAALADLGCTSKALYCVIDDVQQLVIHG